MGHVIKRDRIRVVPAGPKPARAKASASHDEKAVRLVRVDGRVQAIELTCTCGQVSVLEIDYNEAGSASNTPPAADAAEPTS